VAAELEPESQALLERMAIDFAGGSPDPTVEERRAALRWMAAAYGPEPAPVAAVEDRTIAGPAGPIPVRIYRPEAAEGRPPLLVHFHGGGWVLGDFEAYERVCRAYAVAGGCVVVDVGYRRAPEHKHPAAIRDCEAALAWADAQARALGCDPGRIVVAGDSAGGNLAAAACLRTRVRPALQILVYPVLSASRRADFASRRELGDGRYFLREFDIRRAEQEYLPNAGAGEKPSASPLLARRPDLARAAPALIVTAGLDPLRDEAVAYAARLEAAGVPVEHRCFEGTIHGFVLFAGAVGLGREAIRLIGERVRTAPRRRRGWFG
jgi:acetyl esterase